MRVIVIGAGAMGLAAAYHASSAGHEVTVVEAGPVAGGMAAHFDFGGLSLERFYHFICKADQPTFDILRDLGISDRLKWRQTTMGFYIDGKLRDWGDPFSLLRFSAVSAVAKVRYGLLAFVSTKREHWHALEHQTAREWITRWAGKEAYQRLWEPLFRLKFYEFADDISAAWIWTRVKRIGRSRRSLFKEELGYLEGGSETLVRALVDGIEANGGAVQLATPAQRVEVADGRVTGVRTAAGVLTADAVISTVPTPLVAPMVPDLPAEWAERYASVINIGVCCLVFRLKRSVSPHFWVNISDPAIEIPGIVEFSNLRPTDETIVFVPYYMPLTHPKWSWSDEQLLDEAWGYVCRLNPTLKPSDRIDGTVSRLRYAQPVCPPGFAATIPPIQTPIKGLQVADTSFYYPEDRGISESVRLGKLMAEMLEEQSS
ncbi:NAD(P)/FAD-dependent oxidoreductase [uncultured Sphingomonas sp.]|uniref:NAD(P)/FAD-dependent oxidoreductase n=1 Tax=uncultured Sphingomonas sp. TaxID=158754 RepID=UPI0035CBD820